ncbi:MAG: hypothetical protein HY329_02480 [Chloroflexi bacterium]|nr:hypothetical protein [Chloroflexota bacterium]
MRSEKLKILEMVAQRQLTPVEALDLFEAMDIWDAQGPRPRWLRVRLTREGENRSRVDVGVPMDFVTGALKAGLAIVDIWTVKAPGADFEAVKRAYDAGQSGLIVDAFDPEARQWIQLTLE